MAGAIVKTPFINQLAKCPRCGLIDKLKKHTDGVSYCLGCIHRLRIPYTKVERRKNAKSAVA